MIDVRPGTRCEVPGTRDDRAGFAPLAFDAFERAARAAGGAVEQVLLSGPDRIRLRFAGPAMVPVIAPALSHLFVDDPADAAALTIAIWDSASTGVAMPSPPWGLDGYVDRGEVRHGEGRELRVAFHTEGSILNLYERPSHRAMYWTRDAAGVPYYERGSPCRSILGWWSADRGRQLTHAAAVGRPDGCVLLAGRGGSGKSNTALQCLSAGLSYLADDYCLITAGETPRAHALFGTGKVHGADLVRFPMLVPYVDNAQHLDVEKALFFFNRHLPDRLLRDAPIRAVVVPRVAGTGASRLERVTPVDALLALAPSTTAQLPHAGAEVMHTLTALVRAVPCYRLTIGSSGADTAALIAALLDGGGQLDG